MSKMDNNYNNCWLGQTLKLEVEQASLPSQWHSILRFNSEEIGLEKCIKDFGSWDHVD